MYKSKFKSFGGSYIPDIIEYLREYIKNEPSVTITVGADSIQKRKRTIYAITIMLYNTDIKRGEVVVFADPDNWLGSSDNSGNSGISGVIKYV